MTVLVGYTATAEGRAALVAGVAEARLRDAKLLVLNTSLGDSPADPRYALDDDLQWARATAEDAGVACEIRQYVGPRTAAEEVLDRVREEDAQLVVLGLRRRSPVGKLLLGSTAQQILLQADCPVLAVKVPAAP